MKSLDGKIIGQRQIMWDQSYLFYFFVFFLCIYIYIYNTLNLTELYEETMCGKVNPTTWGLAAPVWWRRRDLLLGLWNDIYEKYGFKHGTSPVVKKGQQQVILEDLHIEQDKLNNEIQELWITNKERERLMEEDWKCLADMES